MFLFFFSNMYNSLTLRENVMARDIVLDVTTCFDAISVLRLCQPWQPHCSVILHSILASWPDESQYMRQSVARNWWRMCSILWISNTIPTSSNVPVVSILKILCCLPRLRDIKQHVRLQWSLPKRVSPLAGSPENMNVPWELPSQR